MKTPFAVYSLCFVSCFAFVSCSTTYTRDGKEIPADYAEAVMEDTDQIDVSNERIKSVVKAVNFERGPALLQNLQWLIAQKELAVPIIAENIASGGSRTKANLLYVLGFARSEEATAALTSHMHHEDEIVRYEAAAGLLNQGDNTAVPVLVEFLDSSDRRFRFKAIQVLRERTGRSFNYQFSADQEARQPSIRRWKNWWNQEKQRLMYRPKADKSS